MFKNNILRGKFFFIIASSLFFIFTLFLITRINQNIHIMEEHYHQNINYTQQLTNIRHDFTQTILELKKHLLKPTINNGEKLLYLWSKIKKILEHERFFQSQDIEVSRIIQKIDKNFKKLDSSLNINNEIEYSNFVYNLITLQENLLSNLKAIQNQQYSVIDEDYQYIIHHSEQNFYLVIAGISIFIFVFFLILFRYISEHKQLSQKITSLLNTLPIKNKPTLPPLLNVYEKIDILDDNLNSFFKELTHTFNEMDKITNKINDSICSKEAIFNHHLKTVLDNVINNTQILANINNSANDQLVDSLTATEKIVIENNHIESSIDQDEHTFQNGDILEARSGPTYQSIIRRAEVISRKTNDILSNIELLRQLSEEQKSLINENLENLLQLNQDFYRLNPFSDLSYGVDSLLCRYSVDLKTLLKDYVHSAKITEQP